MACRQNNYTCWKWTHTDCADDGQLCDEGTGVALCSDTCTDACLVDATRCSDSVLQTCGTGANGCLVFATTEDCANTGRLCEAGGCVCPPETCTLGGTRCEGTMVQTCADTGAGCGAWTDGEDCAASSRLCDEGTGTAQCVLDCTSTCTGEGTTACNGDVVRTCTLQVSGCLAPDDTEDCAATFRTCTGGACACVDQCTDGQLQCNVNTVQTCVTDAYGCRRWQDGTDCAAQDQICSAGVCACNNQCVEAQAQCSGSIPQTCVVNGSGCWNWSDGAACVAPLTFCGTGACHGYTRTDFSGTYSDITGGTSLSSSADDDYFTVTLPFSFSFWGQPYGTIYVSSNGWLSFDSVTSSYLTNATSLPATGDPNMAIYGLWDALVFNTSTYSNSNPRWQTLGSAPNRVVVVQWRSFYPYNYSSNRGSFQIRLYETSNVIEFLYHRSNFTGSSFTSTIGIEDDSRGLAMLVNGSVTSAPSSDYRFTPY